MKKIIIFTSGTWDLLHEGHINVLKKAKAFGDYLIVGVSTNKLIKSYKNVEPILNYKQRKNIIEELKCVDKVVKQNILIDIKQFKKLNCDFFVLGDDWKGKEHLNEGLKWLKENKKIKYIPYTKGLSTSEIKKKIIKNSYNIIKAELKREK